MTDSLAYTEDTLVQQTTADYLEQQLGWESIYAHNNEDFGPDSLLGRMSEREVVLTRFNQLELLQGCRDDKEWLLLSNYLEDQTYIEASVETWQAAARIYYDLRRQGLTVRSPIDCCIAQIAIENELLLLHNDKDFSVIHQIRPLIHHRWQ